MMRLQTDERGVRVACSACGQANRLPFENLATPPRCGRCKAALSPPGEVIDCTGVDEFDRIVERSALPVLVDFWASWCGPCRLAGPEVAKAARLAAGELLVVKVSTEELEEVAARHQINAIPTFAVFYKGRELRRASGLMQAAQLHSFAREAVRGAS